MCGWGERCFSDKQIKQLDGTNIADSFNYNTNRDIEIQNKNNKEKSTISI